MNNINKTSGNGIQTRSRFRLSRKILLTLAIGVLAHRGQVQAQQTVGELRYCPAWFTGYAVEVHTSSKQDAQSDGTILMKLEIRDDLWRRIVVGAWELDTPNCNDFMSGTWNTYFFENSQPAPRHIEKLWMMNLDTDGWLWNELNVTYIKRGLSVWTWHWTKEEWIDRTGSWPIWDGPFYFAGAGPGRGMFHINGCDLPNTGSGYHDYSDDDTTPPPPVVPPLPAPDGWGFSD